MGVVRWACAAMPVVLAGLLSGAHGAIASLASDPPWQPPPCPAAGPLPAAAGTAGWYRLTPVVDETGTLAGQELTVAVRGNRPRTVPLPPESFASGPGGGQVVVGDDNGNRSRLRIVDLTRGCLRLSIEEPDVIRSALLASDGASVWEHRVDRDTRADLGIWRRSVDDGTTMRVLPGIDADPGYGPTFVTVLRGSADGHLAVASCGALACRTRVLDPDGSSISTVEDTGPPVGFADGRLVSHAACDWWPCAVLAVEPRTGRREVLVDAANDAELGGAGDQMLVYQTGAGELAVMNVASGTRSELPGERGLAPVRRGSVTDAGVDLPPGRVLLAANGRMDDIARAWQLDPDSRVLTTAEEVAP